MPYHWDALGGTVCRAHYIYQHGLNPLSGPFYYGGHPPLFYEILAITWSLLGYSIWITHLIAIIFSFIGIYFTYLLGRELKDRKTGIVAALLLFLSPLYFAQSGILNLDLPLTVFVVMTIYFVLKENTKGYLISGICLVMTKEPGLLLILSILIYTLFRNWRKPKTVALKRLLIYSIPLIFFLCWLVYHKWKMGWFLYPWIFTYQIDKISFSLYERMKAIFFEDYRFLISACMFSYIFLKKWDAILKKPLYYFLLMGLLAFLIKILFAQEKSFLFFSPGLHNIYESNSL